MDNQFVHRPSDVQEQAEPHHVSDQKAPTPTKKPRSVWRELLSFVSVFVVAILIALGLIFFVFQSYQVDGPSMQNTLHSNDRLIVWKVPVTWAHITGHPYIPKRGDIIVFNQSGLAAFGQSDEKQLIKRVVGLPGDRVVVANGRVTIYNAEHPGGWSPSDNFDGPNGNKLTGNNGTWTLGKDQLFVMGDNRPDSLDSRVFGPINAKNVIGKLVLRIFPISQAKAF